MSHHLSKLVAFTLSLLVMVFGLLEGAGQKVFHFDVEWNEGASSTEFTNYDYNLPVVWVQPTKVTASSTLSSPGNNYVASNIVDYCPETAWCEGSSTNGVGEWVLFEFDSPVPIMAIYFTPFYAKSEKAFRTNVKTTRIRIEMQNVTGEASFNSEMLWCNDCQLAYPAPYINLMRSGNLGGIVITNWMKFTILEVADQFIFPDACISEIQPIAVSWYPPASVRSRTIPLPLSK